MEIWEQNKKGGRKVQKVQKRKKDKFKKRRRKKEWQYQKEIDKEEKIFRECVRIRERK